MKNYGENTGSIFNFILNSIREFDAGINESDIAEALDGKGIKIYKTLVGNYMTSLDMEGFSITLLKVDDELKKLLDAPADTPAFVQA